MISLATLALSAGAILCVVSLWSFLSYSTLKRCFPGPSIVLPLIGSMVPMVKNPTTFWEEQRVYNPDGLSLNSLAGKFLLFCTNTKLAKEVFSSQLFVLYVHPAARWLMHANFVHLNGTKHSEFRKPLLPAVFSPEALKSYLMAQEDAMRRHLSEFIDGQTDVDIRLYLQRMNTHVSQMTLIGPYVTPEQSDLLSRNLLDYTMGWLGIPFPIPGNACWKAWRAMHVSLNELEGIVKQAKARMFDEPTEKVLSPQCALDYWLREQGRLKKVLSTRDIALTIHDFLFASQDATTAALVWATCLVVEQPEVMHKVREEVYEKTENGKLALWQVYPDLKYVHAVVSECLRKRPPVPMVPHVAAVDAELPNGTLVKKGTVVIPSITGCAASNDKDWNDKTTFRPEDNKDPDFLRTLVFGGGQHKCPGRRIAQQVVGMYIALLATEYDVTRTKFDSTLQYLPTLYPLEARFSISRRLGVCGM